MAAKRHNWTESEVTMLFLVFEDAKLSAEDICAYFPGVSWPRIWSKANSLGLRTPPERLSRYGKQTSQHPRSVAARFQKGMVPANKGKKVSAEVYEAMSKTMFKPGNRPKNYLPIGSEVKDRDGYIKRKVAEPNKWAYVHRLVWEEANGAVPDGHAVVFRDGDKTNTALENLELVSRHDLMKRNSMYENYPPELVKSILVAGALKRKMTEKRKRENGTKK